MNTNNKNIVFISVDDLNDWIGVLNEYPGVKTPNIDRLAQKGITFTNAHTPIPICNSARTAVLTGLSPDTTGVYHNSQDWRKIVPDDVKTIPEAFKDGGYKTAGFGKLFHATYDKPELYDEYFAKPAELDNSSLPQTPFPYGPINEPTDAFGDAQIASKAVDFLGESHSDPFFLGVGFFRPHPPLVNPQSFFDQYPIDQVQLPATINDDLNDVGRIGQALASPGAFQDLQANEQWDDLVQAYLASITYADEMVGRVLDAVEQSSHANDTVIVLWSDHGWHLGEKERISKSTLWEESTRVPLIIYDPDNPSNGSQSDSPVSLLDLYPTLMDLANLGIDSSLDGDSLAPLLSQPGLTIDKPVVTVWENNYSVRTKDWRYTRYWDGFEELYNHQTDQNEWTNVAEDSSFSSIKSTLSQHLDTYLLQYSRDLTKGTLNNDALNGDDQANIIIGDDGNDTIAGNRGRDSIFGWEGNDVLQGGKDRDLLRDNLGSNKFYGGQGDDFIEGGVENDTLNGGSGADIMFGNDGDNLFIVDHVDDLVRTSSFYNNTDKVISSVDFRISAYIEQLSLTQGAIIGRGNGQDNMIIGNGHSNSLIGANGDDTIKGLNGDDTILGGNGDDILTGGNGNDRIVGGADLDRLIERKNVNFRLTDSSLLGNGVDTLIGIEKATLIAGSSDNLINGNEFSGDVHFKGHSGDDTLIGSQGYSVLQGGSGDDLLIVEVENLNVTRIVDFQAQKDELAVALTKFSGNFNNHSQISSGQFTLGSNASSSSHNFIYNQSTGALWFDEDGVGGIQKQRIATLVNQPFLTFRDISTIT